MIRKFTELFLKCNFGVTFIKFLLHMQHQRAADIRVMLETNSHFEQTLEMLCEMLYRSLRRVLFTY